MGALETPALLADSDAGREAFIDYCLSQTVLCFAASNKSLARRYEALARLAALTRSPAQATLLQQADNARLARLQMGN